MNLKKVGKLGTLLGKGYAEDFFKLLHGYETISASEAASRLELHIKTAQDFLETMARFEIVHKEEVYEKKRPYYRYSLLKDHLTIEVDLSYLRPAADTPFTLETKIREKKNASVRFTAAKSHRAISRIFIWSGYGKKRKERILNLTLNQGKFLYHLPFPTASPISIEEIMKRGDIPGDSSHEIMDILSLLSEHRIVETFK